VFLSLVFTNINRKDYEGVNLDTIIGNDDGDTVDV
jgi:hypothetical protein